MIDLKGVTEVLSITWPLIPIRRHRPLTERLNSQSDGGGATWYRVFLQLTLLMVCSSNPRSLFFEVVVRKKYRRVQPSLQNLRSWRSEDSGSPRANRSGPLPSSDNRAGHSRSEINSDRFALKAVEAL